MIAVIFEVWPDGDNGKRDYLGLAAALRSDLTAMDGFISVERFQSLSEPGKLLSLSFWRDEIRDYGLNEREEAPTDSRSAHEGIKAEG
jgi:heme-degrading monooxygenase HmoA